MQQRRRLRADVAVRVRVHVRRPRRRLLLRMSAGRFRSDVRERVSADGRRGAGARRVRLGDWLYRQLR